MVQAAGLVLTRRIGIAVDVSTDVSAEFVAGQRLVVLPSILHIGDRQFSMDRHLEDTRRLVLEDIRNAGTGHTSPPSVADLEALFLDKLVLEYDYVFVITLTSSHSPTFRHAQEAAVRVMQRCDEVRREHGVEGPFALRLIDSESAFTGPAVLAWEAARMVRQQCRAEAIDERLDDLVPRTRAYVLPRDAEYFRSHGGRKGRGNLSWIAARLWGALDAKPILAVQRGRVRVGGVVRSHEAAARRVFRAAAEQLKRGIDVPCVALSFAGDLDEMRELPGYAELRDSAVASGAELMESMMSAAGTLNVGCGALSVGYCSPKARRTG